MGKTFSDHLTRVRLEKAKELLERGDLRLGDVSVLVGYEWPEVLQPDLLQGRRYGTAGDQAAREGEGAK